MKAVIAASQTDRNPLNGPHDLDGMISATAYTTGITAIANEISKINMNNEFEREARYKIDDGFEFTKHANFLI